MAKRIVIVGELTDSTDRADFLHQLYEAHPSIEWQWVKCDTPAYNLPRKPFNKLLDQLRNPQPNIETIVVKLALVNGRETNSLYKACPDPILAPTELATGEDLLHWLFSDEAALVKEPAWQEPLRVGALLAILAKLIGNKSWNNNKQGHAWTQEADLLGQAPVYRKGGPLYAEAGALLNRMEDVVLLCKGGKQGKTKKEWCICLDQLPPVKRVILARSVQAFREIEPWSSVLEYADKGPEEIVIVDDEIVSEIVRHYCRHNR